MTTEQFKQAADLTRQIDNVKEMEVEMEVFRSTKFRDALPSRFVRYMSANPERALRYAELIMAEAQQEKDKLQSQLDAL
jgi:hypothetical protein